MKQLSLIAFLIAFLAQACLAGEIKLTAESGEVLKLTSASINAVEKFELKDGELQIVGYEISIFSIAQAKEIFKFTGRVTQEMVTITYEDVQLTKTMVMEAIGSGRLLITISKEKYLKFRDLLREQAKEQKPKKPEKAGREKKGRKRNKPQA